MLLRLSRTISLLILIVAGILCPRGRAQAALLMEEAYGLSRMINPTGHVAIYFARICAETPLRLRRCEPGELGSVIARYNGVGGYDWIAMPLIPYLYAVDNPSDVPERVSHGQVTQLRSQYLEAHLQQLLSEHRADGDHGWDQLAGVSYNRAMYSFRFNTTAEQDDAFIAAMNSAPNHTHFHILTNNCANFAARVLNSYFPGVFRRHALPDAGIESPRQLAHDLEKYAGKHPEIGLTVGKIPQIPGYHRRSRQDKSVVESFIESGDVVPLAILNPYVAAGLGADFLVFGRYPLQLKGAQTIGPRNLQALATGGPDAGPEVAARRK